MNENDKYIRALLKKDPRDVLSIDWAEAIDRTNILLELILSTKRDEKFVANFLDFIKSENIILQLIDRLKIIFSATPFDFLPSYITLMEQRLALMSMDNAIADFNNLLKTPDSDEKINFVKTKWQRDEFLRMCAQSVTDVEAQELIKNVIDFSARTAETTTLFMKEFLHFSAKPNAAFKVYRSIKENANATSQDKYKIVELERYLHTEISHSNRFFNNSHVSNLELVDNSQSNRRRISN